MQDSQEEMPNTNVKIHCQLFPFAIWQQWHLMYRGRHRIGQLERCINARIWARRQNSRKVWLITLQYIATSVVAIICLIKNQRYWALKKKNPNKCPKLPQHTSLTEVFPASSSVTVTQQILLRAGQCGEIKTLHSPWQVMWHTFACDTQICECGHEDKIQDWFIKKTILSR